MNRQKTEKERKINMMKKTVSILMAAAMTLGSAAYVFADADTAVEDATIIKQEVSDSANLSAFMTVKEVSSDTITAETDEKQAVELKISDKTIFIDSELAIPFSASELKDGDRIYVEYSSVMTKSLPPQSNAYLIATNVEKGGTVNLMKADTVDKDENGNIAVFDKTQNIVLTILKDASVKPYATKNIIKAEDIVPGTEFVAWYGAVTLSIPAYASTDKVVVTNIPEANGKIKFGTETVSDDALKADPSKIKLLANGKEVTLSKPMYFEENTLMVPLRAASEALGYTVGWDAETGAITVEDEYIQKATLYNGSNEVTFKGKEKMVTMDRKVENTKATVIHDGTTFVPIGFFTEFTNDVNVNAQTAHIAAQKAEASAE